MNLKNLVVDTKTVTVPFPSTRVSDTEPTICLRYMSRAELIKLREKCTTKVLNRKTRAMEDELNEKLFSREFSKRAIAGWEGVTIQDVAEFLALDEESITDFDELVEYSVENAHTLVENSSDFDQWLNDKVFELDTFRRRTED